MDNFKSIYIYILLIFGMSAQAYSQDYSPRFLFGAKGGMLYSMVGTDVVLHTNFSLNSAPFGGIRLQYNDTEHTGLLLEVNYLQKGGVHFFATPYLEGTENIDPSEIYYNLNLDYLEIPVLTQLSVGKRHSKYRLNFGPHLAFLTGESLSFLDATLSSGYKENIDRKFEFGLNLGFAYAYTFPSGEIDIEVRYSQGLTNLYEPASINPSTVSQNQSVSICAGYCYNILFDKSKRQKTEKSNEKLETKPVIKEDKLSKAQKKEKKQKEKELKKTRKKQKNEKIKTEKEAEKTNKEESEKK